MSDLISRQVAIEATWFEPSYTDPLNVLTEVRDKLKALPSAQPEIIYCKKCEHWTRTYGNEQWGLGDCDVFDKHLVRCNGYCAWAERRTDEAN